MRINLKSHLTHLVQLILLSLTVFFVASVMNNANSDNHWFVLVIYIIYSILGLINLYLHIEYFIVNFGFRLYYDKDSNVLKVQQNHEEFIIKPNDVKAIEINQAINYNQRGGFLLTDQYRFCKIILNNNKEIIITSLLYKSLDFDLTENIVIVKRFLPSIYLHRKL